LSELVTRIVPLQSNWRNRTLTRFVTLRARPEDHAMTGVNYAKRLSVSILRDFPNCFHPDHA